MVVSARQAEAAPETVLATDGQPHLEIVVGADADESVRETALALADYLERISGAAFTVTAGDGSGGLVLGVPTDFSALPFEVAFGSGSFDRAVCR